MIEDRMSRFVIVCALASVAIGVVLMARPAAAEHPVSCEWEYGGVAEVHPAKCDQPVAVTNWPDTQTVSVANHPTQYPVVNVPGDRVDVDAKCEPDVPCVANGNAQEVLVTNTDTDMIPVAAGGRDGQLAFYAVAALGMGVVAARAVNPTERWVR